MSKFNLVKQTYEFATFSAYDYASVKRVLIDRIKTEFPEVFNDFTEFDELMMIINSFAYISELFAYRLDITAQENFIQTAEVKENIIRLAEWIGYSPKRCIPARGLFKITSVAANFNVTDARGLELRGREIRWNDNTNIFWKSQFLAVIQSIVREELLNADENKRVQINNTLVEQYTISTAAIKNGVVKFSSNNAVPFELLPSKVSEDGFLETTPSDSNQISMFLLDDNSGDSSSTSGFFLDAVQGILNSVEFNVDQIVPNFSISLSTPNINQFDIWLYNKETNTYWTPVDKLFFTKEITKNTFKVQSNTDNSIQLFFGDGVISNIPLGNFVLFYRSSINNNSVVDKQSLTDIIVSVPVFINNRTQSVTFKISSDVDLQTTASETKEHIKRVATNHYQSQDRLVNEYDYNNFLIQDSRILCNKIQHVKQIGTSAYYRWNKHNQQNYEQFSDGFYIFTDHNISYQENVNGSIQYVADNILSTVITSINVIQTSSFLNALNPTRTYFHKTIGGEYDQLLYKLGYSPSQVVVPAFPFAIRRSTTEDKWVFVNITKTNGIIDWSYDDIIVVDYATENTNKIWKIYTKETNINFAKDDFVFVTDDSNIAKQSVVLSKFNSIDGTISGVDYLFKCQASKFNNTGNVIQNTVTFLNNDVDANNIPDFLNITTDIPIATSTYVVNTYVDGAFRYFDVPGVNFPCVPATNDILSVKDTADLSVAFSYDTVGYTPTRKIKVFTNSLSLTIKIKQYLFVELIDNQYVLLTNTYDTFNTINAYKNQHPTKKRVVGKSDILVKYQYSIPFFTTLDAEQTNLIRIKLITNTMFESYKNHLRFGTNIIIPNAFELISTFGYLIAKRMTTDNVKLVSGRISSFIGATSNVQRQAQIIIKKNPKGLMLAADIKSAIISILTNTFEQDFVMGETVFVTQLVGILSYKLLNEILDVRIVGKLSNTEIDKFVSDDDELLYPHVTFSDIVIT